jgi:hypothetical protein
VNTLAFLRLYEQASKAQIHPSTWNFCKPFIIAHDVGRAKDRSTAVVGGTSPFAPDLVNLKQFTELPQGLYASRRAEALYEVDRQYDCKTLVVADLTQDPSYGEMLHERFGDRLIGVHITRTGDGLGAPELRLAGRATYPVYTVRCTYLFDLLHREFNNDKVRLLQGPDSVRAYEQLMNLEVEYKESGMIYACPSGHHDDLAISCAMLIWAARHPHLAR